MIRYKDYAIDADGYGYTAGKLATVKDAKTNEQKEQIVKPKYYGSIAHAVAGMRDMIIRETVSKEDLQLDRFVKRLEEIDDGIRAALEME